ncbi:MAG TPA: hypothetical protein VF488_12145 [Gemmatimonadaceae bacterium]
MRYHSRRFAGLGVAVVLATSLACNNFLGVDNPSSVNVGNLSDSSYANLLVTGAIGEFQSMYPTVAMYGSVLSDESRSDHVNASYGPIDQRAFTNLNDIDALTYNPLQRTRYAADTVADRFVGYFGAKAGTDLRVARMLALGGYTYMLLGETFCGAPINMSRAYTPQELFQMARPKLDSAVAIATAAKAAGARGVVADSIIGLALVAAARTSLDLGDLAAAGSYAAQVPNSAPTFTEYRVYFIEGIPPQSGMPTNPYWSALGQPLPAQAGANVTGGIQYLAADVWVTVGEAFQGVHDPRMPMSPSRVKAMDNSMQYVANKPASFGGFVRDTGITKTTVDPSTGDTITYKAYVGAPMTPGASIRIASSLEARYIAAEASGGDASTLAFVNAQRSANGQTPSTATSPDSVLADLREQRRREFYLDGHRLGDIRRYETQYGASYFPTGPFPGSTEQYGTQSCFVIPISEVNSNPNL